MFSNPGILRVAYAANILILMPVCRAMLTERSGLAVFQGAVAESAGLRLLVFTLWLAMLLASVAGLFAPALFAPVLMIQIVYKTAWLALFVAPLVTKGQPAPIGVAATFAAIVLSYPVLLALAR